VLLKLVIFGFVAVSVGRLLFASKMKGLGQWFSRVIDTTLIVIGVVLVVQWAFILSQ